MFDRELAGCVGHGWCIYMCDAFRPSIYDRHCSRGQEIQQEENTRVDIREGEQKESRIHKGKETAEERKQSPRRQSR